MTTLKTVTLTFPAGQRDAESEAFNLTDLMPGRPVSLTISTPALTPGQLPSTAQFTASVVYYADKTRADEKHVGAAAGGGAAPSQRPVNIGPNDLKTFCALHVQSSADANLAGAIFTLTVSA